MSTTDSNRIDRPWGYFETIAENRAAAPYWKLKKIVVNPNQALSLQSHEHRTEFWFVTKGSGIVLNGPKDGYPSISLQEIKVDSNSKIVINENDIHRITAGSAGCEFFEFAFSITHPIDESDITRYQDRYGRT